jgi:hypothetical protein
MTSTVKSRFQEPRGPRLIKMRYTIRPATTGGIPIRVRQILTTIRFPGKRALSRNIPRTVPIIAAKKVDVRDILRVTQIIPKISESKIARLILK